MFDFHNWRAWLKEKASELRGDGFITEWKANDKQLRGTSLSVSNDSRIGNFRTFENGLVDYEVMDVVAKTWVANEAMIPVDDQNFAEVFQKFVNVLKTKAGQ